MFLASKNMSLLKDLEVPQGLHFADCNIFEIQN